MQDDTYSELELRIKSIEKKQKRSKFTNLFLLLIIISGLMYGFQMTQKFKTLEVEKLVLIDSLGKQRAVMMFDEKFDPQFQMFNKNGDEVFNLCISEEKAAIDMPNINYIGNYSGLRIAPNSILLASDTIGLLHLNTSSKRGPYIYLSMEDSIGSSFKSTYKSTSINWLHSKNGSLNSTVKIENYGRSDSLGILIGNMFSDRDSSNAEIIDLKITDLGPSLEMYDFNKTNFKFRQRQSSTIYGTKFNSHDGPDLIFGYNWFDLGNVIRVNDPDPGMRILDKNDSVRLKTCIRSDNDMVYTAFFGNSCSEGTYIGNLKNNGFLEFHKNDRKRLTLNFTDYGVPRLSMFDYYGNIRLNLGGMVTTRNGRSINNYESSIFLFNEKGNSLFSAP